MDNATRSERTRSAVIQAALAIIARDGPGRLTLDAIARECGISKGALTHQFRSKAAVLKALLEHQAAQFEAFSAGYAEAHAEQAQPRLAAQIATMREALSGPSSVAFALFGALAEEPALLAPMRELSAAKLATLRGEAADADLATLRWLAARGLLFGALLGVCPLSESERENLFEQLLDERRWAAPAQAQASGAG